MRSRFVNVTGVCSPHGAEATTQAESGDATHKEGPGPRTKERIKRQIATTHNSRYMYITHDHCNLFIVMSSICLINL